MPAYYHNEGLFSEIYLEEITRQAEKEEINLSLKVLREFREYAHTEDINNWVKSYVGEVFSALGFISKHEEKAIYSLADINHPDSPLTVCIILGPEGDLNNTTMGCNWMEKAIRAIRNHGLDWGLLTNGKIWRIVHQEESQPYETYLEMNLESILHYQAKDAYRIFYQFLKAQNFQGDKEGKCRFDQFKQDSLDKIAYIEKELANALRPREEGGKGVLSDICLGYVQELRQSGTTDFEDENLRKRIYHGAMLYMFRLLFLFYSDARGLLSDVNHCLLETVKRASQDLQTKGDAGASQFNFWQQIDSIFVDIDQTYNGGLFSPQESEFTRFISETRIDDHFLSGAIYFLTTYREKNREVKLICYRDMGVRHLGTLYEGLLEHKLFIAEEDIEVKVAKDKISFIPFSQGGKMVVGHYIKTGEVYFASDSSERKSSGSYYTPEYIVDYIVRNTVGEKLKELKKSFLLDENTNLEAFKRAVDEKERNAVASLLEENVQIYIQQKILQLSVLDPAMGSGHFLVNAANLIANSITELINEIDINSRLESGTAYWRRWVAENCIYGVDLNPLAVELAKLSLWILTMAKEQPLSFLNHHLKCGNSLVGADLKEIGIYPFSTTKRETRQLGLFEQDPDFKATVEDVVSKSRLITSKSSMTLDDVSMKKDWLDEIEHKMEGYKTISDVHTSLYFGFKLDETQYTRMIDEKDISLAQALNQPNRYFHWELEFPEVCISKGGFSCVVCNPPYDIFKETAYFLRGDAAGCGNLFGHFIVKAKSINLADGNLGFVVPLSFACGSSFEAVRKTIYQDYGSLHASHYSLRPNMLFDGVQQRITIFYALGKSNKSVCELFSSKLWRWKKTDQEYVVRNPNLTYVGSITKGIIPKIEGKTGADIYNLLIRAPKSLSYLFNKDSEKTNFVSYYHSVSRYWIKAYDFIPYFKRGNDSSLTSSSNLKVIYFETEINKKIFLLLMNSSLFYYWWMTNSDEFHVLISEIRNFGLRGYDRMVSDAQLITVLVDKLMRDYQEKSFIKSTTLGGKRVEYQEFYPRNSLKLINQIDDYLAPIYGLSDEQNDFLKNFDLCWRTDAE